MFSYSINQYLHTWINISAMIRYKYLQGCESNFVTISFLENSTLQRNFQNQYQLKVT